eukprot:7856648-Alexandrium_andersonii.AAC.1
MASPPVQAEGAGLRREQHRVPAPALHPQDTCMEPPPCNLPCRCRRLTVRRPRNHRRPRHVRHRAHRSLRIGTQPQPRNRPPPTPQAGAAPAPVGRTS